MGTLPKLKSDRVVGEEYIFRGEIRIWDGKLLKCQHGRQRHNCLECGGKGICEHGRRRPRCKDCGGREICEHGRNRYDCKDCGGKGVCEHGRKKNNCKDCGGSGICEHNRVRSICKDCGGSQICEHGVQEAYCKKCGGSQICEHGSQKGNCVKCEGTNICEHGKREHRCVVCGGNSICEHGIEVARCKDCGGDLICDHGIYKFSCMLCKPNAYIASLLSSRMVNVLKGRRREGSLPDLLGCSIDEFRAHLENQFEAGMSWDNHGEWHIDHRRPCASFDLVNEDEQRMCFHYTNLQPLWATDNLSKSDDFDAETFQWEWSGGEWKAL